MKKYYYIIIGLALALTSCKKETILELNNTSGSEDIYFNGVLGTEPINLNTQDNYYMFSSFSFDSLNEVYVFTAELKERYCTNDCGTSVKIKVNNYTKSPGGVVNFDFDSIFSSNSIKWNDYNLRDELGLAEIIIQKKNEPAFSSQSNYQPNSNTLNVSNVELYNINELGQKTVKVNFDGKVLFETSMGNKLFVFDGSFAFAFP